MVREQADNNKGMKGHGALWMAVRLWRVLAVSVEVGVKGRGSGSG